MDEWKIEVKFHCLKGRYTKIELEKIEENLADEIEFVINETQVIPAYGDCLKSFVTGKIMGRTIYPSQKTIIFEIKML